MDKREAAGMDQQCDLGPCLRAQIPWLHKVRTMENPSPGRVPGLTAAALFRNGWLSPCGNRGVKMRHIPSWVSLAPSPAK